jgi:hypothetical protein
MEHHVIDDPALVILDRDAGRNVNLEARDEWGRDDRRAFSGS